MKIIFTFLIILLCTSCSHKLLSNLTPLKDDMNASIKEFIVDCKLDSTTSYLLK